MKPILIAVLLLCAPLASNLAASSPEFLNTGPVAPESAETIARFFESMDRKDREKLNALSLAPFLRTTISGNLTIALTISPPPISSEK